MAPFNHRSLFTVFDICIVILAFTANCIVLHALRKGRFQYQQRGYRRLLLSLVACDLYSCCLNVLTMVYQLSMHWVGARSVPPMLSCFAHVLKTLQLAGFFTNLLTLCSMSVDQFLSVVYPVRYRQVMRDNASKLAVVIIWIASFTFATMDIPINLLIYNNANHFDLKQTPELQSSQIMKAFATLSTNSPMKRNTPDEFGLDLFGGEDSDFNTITQATPLIDNFNNNSAIHFSDGGDSFFNDFIPNNRRNFFPLPVGRKSQNTGQDPQKMLSKILAALENDEEEESTENGCKFFNVKKFWFDICILCFCILCFFLLTVCYGIIFKRVAAKRDNSGRKAKRLAITTILFTGAFAIW